MFFEPILGISQVGDVDKAKRFLQDRGADANSRDIWQNTPLHLAHNEAMVKLLLDHGANVHARNQYQETPLHLAHNEAMAKLLLDHGADVNARNQYRETPLYRAHNEAMTKLLLDHGADVHARGRWQNTPLHLAQTEAMTNLLLDHGADVNARAQWQRTPLHLALDVAIARLLVNRGAQLTAVNENGRNALHCAARNAELDLCLFLVSRGLDPNIADNEGETALTLYGHYLANNNPDDEDEPPLTDEQKQEAVVELLAAREAYEQRVRDEHWKKNWPLMNTLTSSGLRPMNAEVAALAAQQAASDKSVKLPGIPRITKAQNIAFLNQVNSYYSAEAAYSFHNPASHLIQLTNTPLHSNQLSTPGCVRARERALVLAAHRGVHPANSIRGGRGRERR